MPNLMMPQSHDPLVARTYRVRCIVLTSPGLDRIVTRRLSAIGGHRLSALGSQQRADGGQPTADGRLPWQFRIVHDPMLALAELAVVERAMMAEGEAIGSRPSALGEEPTADSRKPTATIFIYALPSGGKSRELFETIQRHMPRVHAITFDEHDLHLLEQNAAMFVRSDGAIGYRPSAIGKEPTADSQQPTAVSISREEIDMLLDAPDEGEPNGYRPSAIANEPTADSREPIATFIRERESVHQ